MNKLTGKLIFKGQTVQVSEKMKKRDFVIETVNEKFPQQIILQLVNDRTDLIDYVNEGTLLDVSYNIRGRSWTDKNTNQTKWFTNLEAWAVVYANANQPTQPAPQYPQQYPQQQMNPYPQQVAQRPAGQSYQQQQQQQTNQKADPFGEFDAPFDLPI
jgi:hypothetical protein